MTSHAKAVDLALILMPYLSNTACRIVRIMAPRVRAKRSTPPSDDDDFTGLCSSTVSVAPSRFRRVAKVFVTEVIADSESLRTRRGVECRPHSFSHSTTWLTKLTSPDAPLASAAPPKPYPFFFV